MDKQQVEMAIGAGLELLGDKSDVTIPVRLNDGIFLLKQLLHLIGSGQMALQPAMQNREPPPIDPPQTGLPNKEKRAAARKKRPQKKK